MMCITPLHLTPYALRFTVLRSINITIFRDEKNLGE